MTSYRKLTSHLPVSLTRQVFAPFRSDTGRRNEKGEIVWAGFTEQVFDLVAADGTVLEADVPADTPADEVPEGAAVVGRYEPTPKYKAGMVFGRYAMLAKAGETSVCIPLVNQSAQDAAAEFEANGFTRADVLDWRLVYERDTEAPKKPKKPALTDEQREAVDAVKANTATPEQQRIALEVLVTSGLV